MTISPAAFIRLPASDLSRRYTSGARPSLTTSQRSWQAVATLLTFCPPGPEAARKVEDSASSGSSKDIAIAPIDEGGRQGSARLDRRLAGALDPKRQRVEQHRSLP